MHFVHTWDCKVIQGHAVKARIRHPLFIPPLTNICNLLRIGAKVLVEFITEF